MLNPRRCVSILGSTAEVDILPDRGCYELMQNTVHAPPAAKALLCLATCVRPVREIRDSHRGQSKWKTYQMKRFLVDFRPEKYVDDAESDSSHSRLRLTSGLYSTVVSR